MCRILFTDTVWGGNIALNFLLKRNPVVRGGVISSPWLAHLRMIRILSLNQLFRS